MASLGIRCGRTDRSSFIQHQQSGTPAPNSLPSGVSQFTHSLPISRKNTPLRRISAAATLSAPIVYSRNSESCYKKILNQGSERQKSQSKEVALPENLDQWMTDSVMEIVKNLKQAPLLVQVYAKNNNGSGTTKLKTERAIAEDWPNVMMDWRDGKRPSPDGVILIEELEGENEDKDNDKDKQERGGAGDDGTRTWGIVIQGRGVECGPACYLLKTSTVGSGLGLFSTHFCLMRVKSFRDSALSQLRDCWLLR